MLTEKHTNNITGTTYVQMMPHTTAVNTGLFFGLRGRVIPTSSACTSGSQAIGYAWEAIRHGYQTIMVAGGAEELCPSEAAIFDTLFATSQRNDEPKTTPAPFDEARDGLVIGEGAGTFVLEELEHAKARGATIYGEIIGFATNCDAAHITQPQRETMQICMEQSLRMAGLSAEDIGYISAHGTATDRGDIAESQASAAVFGDRVPISSLKSYFGHTLGACGALEAWMSLHMMREGWFAPTLNLRRRAHSAASWITLWARAGGSTANLFRVITSPSVGSIRQSLFSAGPDMYRLFLGKISTLSTRPLPQNLAAQAPQGSRRASWLAGRVCWRRRCRRCLRLFTLNTVNRGSPARRGCGLTSATAAMISPCCSAMKARSAAISK